MLRSESQDKDVTRVITALATNISTRRFILVLTTACIFGSTWLRPQASFELSSRRETPQKVMTSAK